jgi:hypothetical protein
MHVHKHPRLPEGVFDADPRQSGEQTDVPRHSDPLRRGTPVCVAAHPPEQKADTVMGVSSYLAIAAVAGMWLAAEFWAWYRAARRH